MSRYSRMGSYEHQIKYMKGVWEDYYRMSWFVDYYEGRIRYPRLFTRDTDEEGAKRFCKRWGLEFPTEAKE